MFHFICTFIVLFIIVSMIWPDWRKKQAEADRKHKELLEAVAKLERESAPSSPTPRPTHNSTERARVLALGRIRDGQHRHPILDAPYTRVASRRDTQPKEVSIIKSGLIDGMPYTLYSDGSIEAQLPQGTRLFGSLTELTSYVGTGPDADAVPRR